MSTDYFTGECPELPTAPLCLGSSRAAAGAVGTAGGVDVHPPETSAARPSIVEALAQIDRLREERDDARAAVHELTSQLNRVTAERDEAQAQIAYYRTHYSRTGW